MVGKATPIVTIHSRRESHLRSNFFFDYYGVMHYLACKKARRGQVRDRMGTKKPMTAAEMQSLGGKARAKKLSPERRSEIASEAAKKRAERLSPARRRQIALDAVRARDRKRKTSQKSKAR